MTVALGLMVKNGGGRIYQYLKHHLVIMFPQSVMLPFDECIIVDDNSDDSTKAEIDRFIEDHPGLKEMIKYYVNPLDFNFSKQRNFIQQMSTCDWVAHIDIDEMIPHDFLGQMFTTLERISDTYDVIGMPRVNIVGGVENSLGDMRYAFVKKDIQWEREIHEYPVAERLGTIFFPVIHIKTQEEQEAANKFYYDNFQHQRDLVDNV